jgi:ABC-type multidrug transport system fused ATPase/permease subunit
MDDTPVTEGEVLIGDDSNLSGSRGSVRYVGQTPTLFRGTILDNLTLFGELPAKTALMASRIVGLNDEIVRMPQGYDTMLKSAAGRDIPAPTAQRLCIARAIAMRPSVLILDEANTLLDFAGEQRFIEALERLRGKITIIVATHRPSLIRMADQAYEVAGGGVKPLDRHTPDEKAAAS